MDVTSDLEKLSVGKREGAAVKGGTPVCLICKEGCSGLQSHSWCKACVNCGCGCVEHGPGSDELDDQQMGRLLTDSPCSYLTTKVRGAGGLRLYKRNRMIVTNPVVSRKDPTFNTTTYTWAPPGPTQKLALQYMDLFSEDRRPVSGTEGALHRRRQLHQQLPVYDLDPMQCQGLTSDEEISSMLLFVRSYKQEVLGVGEVALPGDGGLLLEATNQRRARERKDQGTTNSKEHISIKSNAAATESSNGGTESLKNQYVCTGCCGEVAVDSPVVYAERAGYHNARWHPACFLCSACCQGLVDLVYFWSNQKLFCGRHYCETVWPRCSGCDELIFCPSYRSGHKGRMWHLHHYCCWRCGQDLDTPCCC